MHLLYIKNTLSKSDNVRSLKEKLKHTLYYTGWLQDPLHFKRTEYQFLVCKTSIKTQSNSMVKSIAYILRDKTCKICSASQPALQTNVYWSCKCAEEEQRKEKLIRNKHFIIDIVSRKKKSCQPFFINLCAKEAHSFTTLNTL